MDDMQAIKQQAERAKTEYASVWNAICSKRAKQVSVNLLPFVTSAILLTGDMDEWFDNLGGLGQWQ